MNTLFARLVNDETGFVVSIELIIVSTFAVLSMVLELSEIVSDLDQKLDDVGSAFARISQTFKFSSRKEYAGVSAGISFEDDWSASDDDRVIQHVNQNHEGNY